MVQVTNVNMLAFNSLFELRFRSDVWGVHHSWIELESASPGKEDQSVEQSVHAPSVGYHGIGTIALSDILAPLLSYAGVFL